MLANATLTTLLPVIDLARAREFYERKLGLKPIGLQPDGKSRSMPRSHAPAWASGRIGKSQVLGQSLVVWKLDRLLLSYRLWLWPRQRVLRQAL